jgi:hypothetical protein
MRDEGMKTKEVKGNPIFTAFYIIQLLERQGALSWEY